MAAPKLPPRPVRPKLPTYHPAPASKPTPQGLGGRLKMPRAPVTPQGLGGRLDMPRSGVSPATPAAAGASSVPAAPSSAVLPPDPTYDQQVGAYGRARDTTLSALSGQRTSGLLNYGYNEDATTGALAFDPTNPYSQAAQMKKRYDESRQGTGNRMAASGNLYAGSYQTAQDTVNSQQGASEDAQLKSLIAFLAGNTGARSKAQTDWELGMAGAEGDRVGRAAASPLYSPSGDEPAVAGPTPAALSSKLPIYKKKPGSKGLGWGPRR